MTLSMVFIHLSPAQSGQLSMAWVVGNLSPAAHLPSMGILRPCLLPFAYTLPMASVTSLLMALVRLHSQFKHCLRLISGWNFTHLSSVFLLAGKEIIIPNAKLYENET